MRPPQNAGENVFPASLAYCVSIASMRPPQNAGENEEAWAGETGATLAASMRPPQNAGENGAVADAGIVQVAASMRPPQNAGENVDSRIAFYHRLAALQ